MSRYALLGAQEVAIGSMRRRLKAGTTVAYEPTALDRLVEVQRAVAAAARADRLARDPFGVGLYGGETIDNVVRRQNGE